MLKINTLASVFYLTLKTNTMKKIFLSLAIVVYSICLTAQNADLKLNLEKNKIYRFKSVSSQNVSQTVNGMEQTTTTNSITTFSMKMMDATSDFIIAEVRFDTTITTTNTMGRTVKINSATEGNMASEDAGEVMSSVMNRLSKNPIYVKLERTGKVLDIINLAMLRDIILKDTSALAPKLAPMLKTQIKNSVTLDALKTMIGMYTYNLPARQVKAGEQWNINVPVNSGGMALEIATSYKLGSINGNLASVSAESSVKAAANAAPIEYPGAKVTYDGITGMGKSDITLDTQTGLTTESSSKMNITGDLGVSASGMSMQIPLKISSESSIKTF